MFWGTKFIDVWNKVKFLSLTPRFARCHFEKRSEAHKRCKVTVARQQQTITEWMPSWSKIWGVPHVSKVSQGLQQNGLTDKSITFGSAPSAQQIYSSDPNKRACTHYLILTKLPPYTLLFGPARLFVFLDFLRIFVKYSGLCCVHVNSISNI